MFALADFQALDAGKVFHIDLNAQLLASAQRHPSSKGGLGLLEFDG